MKKDKQPLRAFGLPAATSITLLYFLPASCWIVVSDHFLGRVAENPEQIRVISTYKGWGFVLVTSLLLYGLLRNQFALIKRYQDKLEKRNDFLRGLFDSTYDAIFIQDAETGQVLDINHAAEKLYGISRKQAERVDIGELCSGTYPYTRTEALKRIAAARQEPQMFNWQARKADGSSFWVEVSLQATEIQGEKRLAAVVRDISERYRAEQAQRDSEESFRVMFDQMYSGAILYEPLENGSDFVIIDMNKSALKQAGLKDKSLAGQRLTEAFPGVKESGLLEVLQRVSQTGIPEELPAVHYVDDRLDVWIEAYFYKLPSGRVAANFNNTTERKMAEDALKKREEEFRSTINDLQVGVVVHHADTSITMSNPQAQNLLGLTAEQLTGKTAIDPDWNFVHRDLSIMDVEEYPVSRVKKTGKKLSDMTVGIKRPDREEITWVLANAVPTFTERNELDRIVVNFIDITEREKATEDLEKSKMFLQSTLDGLSAHIALLDENGRILHVNRNWCAFAEDNGMAASEVAEGINYLGVCENATGDEAAQAFAFAGGIRDVLDGKRTSFTMEYPCHTNNGPHWFIARVTPFPGGGPRRAVVAHENITERKLAEIALRQSEENLKITMNSIGDAVMATDRDGRVVSMNPVAEQLTGWTVKDALGRPLENIFRIIDENTGKTVESPLQKVLKTGAIVDLTNHTLLLAKDGREISIADSGAPIKDASGSITGVVLVFRDQSQERIARKALEESESRYRLLFENMSAGFALHEMIRDEDGNAIDYRFLEINPAFERLTGLKESEIIGRTVRELMPNTEAAWIETYGKVEATGQDVSFEDYSQEIGRHFEVRAFRPVPTQFAVIFNDITERKEAEKALTELNNVHSLILDTSTIGIALLENRRFIWVNSSLCEMLDMGEDELKDASAEILYTSREEFETIGGKAYEILGKGERYEHTVRFQRQDGGLFWCRLVGKAVSPDRPLEEPSLWLFEDISEQIESQSELTRLYIAMEQSPETIVITDANGAIQYVNAAFEQTSGYSREDVIGENPRFLKSGEHPEGFYKTMWETITNGRVWKGRLVNRSRNNLLFNEEATIAPVKDANGKITNFVAVKRNITHELIREEELRQAQKMEAVGQLAGGVAHDFNNILQGIQGFSEILEASLDRNSLDYSNVREIKKAAQRASELTRQLLTFSRKQPVNYEQVDINDVITDAESLLYVLLGDGYELIHELDPNLPTIMTDRGQLTQIIMNLAVNARDSMKEGRITFLTESLTLGRQDAARIPEAKPGTYVVLSVTDTGCGISKENQKRLFEPFFTTKELGSGTGLGLSVVYGIVKQHNGWINVYSELGRGTCFRIYFPTPALLDQTVDSRIPSSLSLDPILVVEDDPEISQLIIDIFDDVGCRVEAVSSAEDGLKLLNNPAARFSILICDLELPGMRGNVFAAKIRRKYPDLPILLISGYPDYKRRWNDLELDAFIFLSKPFTKDHLISTITEILKRS